MGEELGVGVSIYFKLLKNMVFINLLFTILSIPSYILFWHSNDLNERSAEGLNFNESLAALTLANLGESSSESIKLGVY